MARVRVLGRLAHLADFIVVGKVEGSTVLVGFQRSLTVRVGLSLIGILSDSVADFLETLLDQGAGLTHKARGLIRILPLDCTGTHVGSTTSLDRFQVSGAGLVGFDVGHSIGFLEPAKEASEQAGHASGQAEQARSRLGIGLLDSRRSRSIG